MTILELLDQPDAGEPGAAIDLEPPVLPQAIS